MKQRKRIITTERNAGGGGAWKEVEKLYTYISNVILTGVTTCTFKII